MKNNKEMQSIKSGGRYAKKKYKSQIIGSIILSLLQEKYHLKDSQPNVTYRGSIFCVYSN